jgi:hypothetical protein
MVVLEPQQHSIFLGGGWATDSLRAREPELANLLGGVSDPDEQQALQERGFKNLFAATLSQEKLDQPAGEQNISDLQIQQILAAMLGDGSLQHPGANTIYVVYLDPALHSTLGPSMAGKHYVAYFNLFNSGGRKIHYVVVPFEEDQDAARKIARRAFVAAALQ